MTDRSSSEWNVAVLADRWIQRWRISSVTEQYLFEGRDAAEVEIRLLDMQWTVVAPIIVWLFWRPQYMHRTHPRFITL